jgi:circadian clock protein KaiB
MTQQDPNERWILFLYVAGMTLAARRALSNIKKICEEHLEGQYTLQIIDLIEHPALAEGHQVFAVPTLVRQLPEPLRKIIGDLADSEKVLVGLDIRTSVTTT